MKGPKQLLIVGAQTFAETQALFSQSDFHRTELLPWYDHPKSDASNTTIPVNRKVIERIQRLRTLTRGGEGGQGNQALSGG